MFFRYLLVVSFFGDRYRCVVCLHLSDLVEGCELAVDCARFRQQSSSPPFGGKGGFGHFIWSNLDTKTFISHLLLIKKVWDLLLCNQVFSCLTKRGLPFACESEFRLLFFRKRFFKSVIPFWICWIQFCHLKKRQEKQNNVSLTACS